jgi:hypothetical protein
VNKKGAATVHDADSDPEKQFLPRTSSTPMVPLISPFFPYPKPLHNEKKTRSEFYFWDHTDILQQ